MRQKSLVLTAVATAMATWIAGTASAQDGAAVRPPLLEGLLACRSLTAESERLACFDRAAAAFDVAEREGEVTVVDRARATETRRRLFGLDLDTANLFGNLRQDAPVEAIETTLVSARQDGRGVWRFMLADGSTWLQIDAERLTARVTPGTPVRIRQGALGSYLLSVNGARSVRARRER